MPRRRITPKEKLAADLKVIITDAEELLKATAAQQGEKISAVRTRVEESLNAARSWVVELEQATEEKAREAAKATDVYIRANPWEAVAIAAGIGFILGTLARRR
jgi:ElaB/YqjD/DUF883 family membrane-anchored ribosome-binding protein